MCHGVCPVCTSSLLIIASMDQANFVACVLDYFSGSLFLLSCGAVLLEG